MRYVPSLPPAPAVGEEGGEIEDVGDARPVRPVAARSLVPLAVRARRQPVAARAEEGATEPPAERRALSDRRRICRRIDRAHEAQMDTRSNVERRKRMQRRDDVKTAIDEEV